MSGFSLWELLRAPYKQGLGLPTGLLAFLLAAGLALPPRATTVDALSEAKTAFKEGDYQTAVDLFTALAKEPNARARYWLAYMTELGLGIARDPAKAIRLYEKAAARDVTKANLRLGEIYLRGNLVPPDFVKARTYLERAALNSNAEAAELLSEIYHRGLGLAADPKEAYAWAEVAVIQGDETARRIRDQLLYSLSLKDLPGALSRTNEILDKLKASRPEELIAESDRSPETSRDDDGKGAREEPVS